MSRLLCRLTSDSGAKPPVSIRLTRCALAPRRMPHNEERFSLGGAAHEPQREGTAAWVRAGERKTLFVIKNKAGAIGGPKPGPKRTVV